jgi:hypothetical protein
VRFVTVTPEQTIDVAAPAAVVEDVESSTSMAVVDSDLHGAGRRAGGR